MPSIQIGLLFPKGLLHAVQAELRIRNIPVPPGGFYPLRNQDLFVCSVESRLLTSLMELRTVEDIFLMLGTPAVLAKRSRNLHFFAEDTKAAILEGLSRKSRGAAKKIRTGYAVFVKQDRDYPMHRKSIAAALSQEVAAHFNRWSYRDPAEVEFWIFISKGKLFWGLRLTELSFRQREYRDEERHGSLLPVVAAAVVVLSKPQPDEFVLDPMCGTGTLLIERGKLAPYRTLHGIDIDRKAIALARANAQRADIQVQLRSADSTEAEPISSLRQQVDVVLCNLPFGKQFETSSTLYEHALTQWSPMLRSKKGRMIILTPHEGTLRRAAKVARMKVSRLLHCNIRGIMAGVYLLVPLKSES